MKISVIKVVIMIVYVLVFTALSFGQERENDTRKEFSELVKKRTELKAEFDLIEQDMSKINQILPGMRKSNDEKLKHISENQKQLMSKRRFLQNIIDTLKKQEDIFNKADEEINKNKEIIENNKPLLVALGKDEKGEFKNNDEEKGKRIKQVQVIIAQAGKHIKISELSYENSKKQINDIKENKQKFERQIAELESEIENDKKIQLVNQENILKREAEIKDLDAKYRKKNEEIINIESDIARALLPINKDQQFKFTVSIVFAALVGAVIIGFFIIAFNDSNVRETIFSGQAGIQFLTLFSIVIAIILFGITGILESRELAALLGGLSGYILGRTATCASDANPRPNAQEGQAT